MPDHAAGTDQEGAAHRSHAAAHVTAQAGLHAVRDREEIGRNQMICPVVSERKYWSINSTKLRQGSEIAVWSRSWSEIAVWSSS
jgi:hypothetical protein